MKWLDPVVLEGARIRLERLDPEVHAAPMFRFFEPRVTEFLSRSGTPVVTERDLYEHLETINALPNRRNWAVRMRVGDHIAGRISYSEINPSDEWLEIGTLLMPSFWGGAASAEGKLLLMTRAFETLGVNRVQFKVDARNERSHGSMEKLGAVREGVLRQYQKRPDGFIRDSVMYSVLKSEWPGVKARLQARLARL